MAYIKKDWVGSRNPLEADPGSTPITEAALDHLETQYDEAVAYTNAQIGAIQLTPGPAGPAGLAKVLTAIGTEARPNVAMVVWIGGTTRPTNMLDGDLWYSTESIPSGDTAPVVTLTSLGTLTVGVAKSVAMTATGTAPISFSIPTGSLPAGLSVSGNNITGTPTAAGAYSFILRASNAVGSADQTISGSVSATATAPVITTTTAPTMTAGSVVSWSPTATGTSPITWGVSAGALPAGVGINSSTGALSGTPTAAGAFSFTLQATNSVGSDTQAFTGSVSAPAVAPAHTIFGDTVPFALMRNVDGTPNIEIATGFYGVGAIAGDKLTKVRLYIPSGEAPSSVTVRAYHPPTNTAPTLGTGVVATGTISSPVAGAWNEATLDTPVIMSSARVVWASYDTGTGVYYADPTALSATEGAVPGADGYFVLADKAPYPTAARGYFRIGTGPTTPQVNAWYGLDVVVEEA